MTGTGFLGCGWGFPIAAGADGEVAMVADAEDVRQAVLLILETEPGERVMRPEFGCGLRRFVFEPLDEATLALLRLRVEAGLTAWEPRIDVDRVAVTTDPAEPAVVRVEVGYRIRSTNTFYNLVYPFYLHEAQL